MPAETIREVQFQYGDTTFSVVFRDSIWTVDADIADATTVADFLGALANIQADDFLDTLPSKPKLIASIAFTGIQLRFSQAKESETFVVQSSTSPQAFELQGWRANQILKRKKDFIKTGS